jgi:opacity protein-like surface antigen
MLRGFLLSRSVFAALGVAAMLGWLPATAFAQGALVNAAAVGINADGDISPGFSGGVAFRVNRALGFGVELTHIRSYPNDLVRILYCCGFDDEEGRATIFTTNVRLEIPTTSSRIIPFVVGGGGVAAVTQSYGLIYARLAADLGASLPATGLTILPGPSNIEVTSTNMALTLGGGASFLVTDHFAIDADLRVLHLQGDADRNLGRFALGVSYRF